MAKVITFSVTFPAYHPRKGEHTNFIMNVRKGYSSRIHDYQPDEDAKHHTIRNGNRWKKGDFCSLRYWIDKPYCSKQQQMFENDVELIEVYKIKIGKDFETISLENNTNFEIYTQFSFNRNVNELIKQLAKNDGLSVQDFKDWFAKSLPFKGQILVFGKDPEYLL